MKENNWWDYPQKIKYWNKEIDNVMFIDENGNSGRIIDISRKIDNDIPINDDEKYLSITKSNSKGIIMLESRGKEEDKKLLKHISNIIVNNNKKLKKAYNEIYGIYFNPKWYNGHSGTFSGLEISDLFSYPIHQYIKYNKENPAFRVIKAKIYSYPAFENEGIIIYPKEKDG